MDYAVVALLALGVVAFALAILRLEWQRATGPAPSYRQHAGRPTTVDGCMTCVLAASGGDDILLRHLSRDHR